MHPVDDHTVFVRVADRGSLTAAGRELRMSTAVVSSRIAKIEDRLGRKLLVRNTRQISLTEEGKIFYAHCQAIIAEKSELEKKLSEIREKPAGAINISVPVALGRKLVAPLIPAFLEEHPDIQARLQVTDRLSDIMQEGIDIAIRKGKLESSSNMVTKIAPDLRIVCGSPDYLERHPAPQTPEELKQHNCLLLRFPGSRRYYWQFQNGKEEVKNIMLAGSSDSNSSDVLIDWAVAGQGLIMKSVWEIYEYLESGALIPVLMPFCVRDMALQALMPPRKEQPVKTRMFIDFLKSRLASHPARKFTNASELSDA